MTDPYGPPSDGTPPNSASGPYGGAPAGGALPPDQDKLYASLAHFLNIILLIPALIIYLVFKDRGPLVRVEAKEALNWTINVTGVVIAANILGAIFAFIPFVGWIISLLLSLVVWAVIILNIVFSIMGGLRVNQGGHYRYPMNIRWIK